MLGSCEATMWDLHLSLGRAPGTIAEQALKRITALYAVEADIRGQPPDERRRQRQARAGPLNCTRDWAAWSGACRRHGGAGYRVRSLGVRF